MISLRIESSSGDHIFLSGITILFEIGYFDIYNIDT
jgi:hypothetical protein